MDKVIEFSHNLISKVVTKDDTTLDLTVGNGNDILNLSNYVKTGKLFGFDIQKKAIENTKNLLDSNNIKNYKLFNTGHENILEVLHDYIGKISLITYNLGYLPRYDKTITTKYNTTIKSIDSSLKLLNNKGMILIVVYPYHKEGSIEHEYIQKYIKKLNNYKASEFHNTDKNSAPYLICIEK